MKLKFRILAIVTVLLLLSINVMAQINGSTNVCAGQTVTYTSAGTAANYNWSVTGAKSYTANGWSVTVLWGSTTLGTVDLSTYDSINNLTSSYSVNVTVTGKPNPVILSSFVTNCIDGLDSQSDVCFAACLDRPVIYSTPLTAGTSFTWQIKGNGTMTTLATNEIEVVWHSLGLQYVKLIATNGAGCTNEYEKCVKVLNSPTAIIGTHPFDTNVIRLCKGSDLFLQDLSTNAIGRRWDFGDGTSSDEVNITHSYDQAGTYQVILTSNNECYCLDSDTITVVVTDTVGVEIICPSVVCKGDTVSYSTPSNCTNFQWSATNGTILGNNSNNTVDIVWNSHLAFIHLEAQNCNQLCDAPTIEKIAVIADSIPIQGPTEVCEGDIVTYSIPPLPGSIYTWGVSSSLSDIIENGEYYIKVKIKDQNAANGTVSVSYTHPFLGCSGSSSLNVSVKPRLSFSFPTEVCQKDTFYHVFALPIVWQIIDSSGTQVVNITDTEIIQYWDLLGSGDYTLVIGGESYCDDLRFPFSILPPPDTVDTIYGPNSVCKNAAYLYSVDPKSGYQIEWLITGGTPSSAVGNKVSVNWNSSGPYEIKAAYRELDPPNCISAYHIKSISSLFTNSPQIIAPDSACGGDTTTFKLNFIADDVKWEIMTTNGASILSDRFKSEVLVQLDASSSRNVTLRAIGHVCGTPFDTTKTIYVQSFPTPNIGISNANPCPGELVRFSTSASNPVWTIDGQTYIASTPQVSFDSAKTISIKLAATYTGAGGCTIERFNVAQLTVKSAPKASIAVNDTNATTCQDTIGPIILAASTQGGTGSNYTYSWSKDGNFLSNSITYTTPAINAHGTYTLTVVGPNGCTSTASYEIIRTCNSSCPYQPSIHASSVSINLDSTGCSEYFVSQVNPSGATLYALNYVGNVGITTNTGPFGKGVIIDKAGTHTLSFSGAVIYMGDTICFDAAFIKTVNVFPDFEIVKEDCGSSGQVQYKMINTSTYLGTQPAFNWNLGGGTSIQQNYDAIGAYSAGTYTVSLSTGSGATCTATKTFIADSPTQANFTHTAPACQQELVQFTDISLGDIAEYKWKFGTNRMLYEQNPQLTFEDGNLSNDLFPNVELFILDNNGCQDSTTQMLTIDGNKFDLSKGITPNNPPAVCEGNSISLAYLPGPTSINPNTPISYQWSNQSTMHPLQANQTGANQLSMTDSKGCRHVTQSVNVQVNTASNPTIVGKKTYCFGDTISLSVLNHPSYSTTWYKDSVVTTNTSRFYKEILPSGNYTFNINTINSSSGCSALNDPFLVTVLSQLPAPTIIPSPNYPLCEGGPIQLTASPAGGNYYWNTGQTGNSITQSLAGQYRVYQTDVSGCTASKAIRINPLPNFNNFLTGCYCLPAVSPPDLLGISGMLSYQWKKDGVNIPPTVGQQQNIPASTGRFELIATTDSMCVDSAGYLDITLGGCEECDLDLSGLSVSCSGTNGDTLFYDFNLNANINNAPASYNTNFSAFVNNSPVVITQVVPDTLSGIGNVISGSFYLIGDATGDSLCIEVTASNPGVNCQDRVCLLIEPLSCDFTPDFTYTINPYTCLMQLTEDADYGFCTTGDSVLYSWTVTQGANTFFGNGVQVNIDSLVQGNAQVCLQMQVYNPLDSTWCTKDTCKTIVIPNCECEDNCLNTDTLSVEFQQFVISNDTCFVEFKIVLSNPNAVVIYPNFIQPTDGQGYVSSITSTFAGPSEVAYIVRYYQGESPKCGEQCFELYLFEGGPSCCLNICVNLPTCSCNLKLSELEMSCSNTVNGYYDFSLLTDLTACDGFNYDLDVKATLGGKTVPIVSQNINNLINGQQILSGTVNLSGKTGELFCIDVTSSLGGISCSKKLCRELPEVDCEITPSFDVDFDPSTCTLILTNTSTTSSCVRLDTTKVDWTILYNGQVITASGQSVTFYNISDSEIEVCLNLTAVDYSGNITCTEEYCEIVEVERCECETECEEMEVTLTDFVSFVYQGNSCLLRLKVEITNNSGVGYTINSILADAGTVVNYSLIQSSGNVNSYYVDLLPNQPWNGGTVCFEAYIQKTGGGICCLPFCVNLPKCGCGLELSNISFDCTGPYGNQGDFNFSFTADLDGTSGYNYASGLSATLNGNPVSINSYNPSNLVNGTQTVSGLITLTNGMPGDTICFTMYAALGGDTCSAMICDTLPSDTCDIVPDFSWSLDTTTCTLTLTDSSQFDPCTYVQTYQWSLTPGGAYSSSSIQINYSGLDSMVVCLTTLGVNYTGSNDCHPGVCKTIQFPPCDPEGMPSERIKAPKPIQEVSVYPNPAKDKLLIQWPEQLEDKVTISLNDQQSRMVLFQEFELNGNQLELDLNTYAEGVYIIEIHWRGQLNRKKIVILR